jgi:hypothetical protein
MIRHARVHTDGGRIAARKAASGDSRRWDHDVLIIRPRTCDKTSIGASSGGLRRSDR